VTPAARLQAAIEILDAIETERIPADRVAGAYTRARRYIGAKDRAAVLDLVYAVLRRRAQLDWWLARMLAGAPTNAGRIAVCLLLERGHAPEQLRQDFAGARHGPALPAGAIERLARGLAGQELAHGDQPFDVRANVPGWILPALTERFGQAIEAELVALNRPAGLDLRVNALKATREEAIRALALEGIEARPTPYSSWGLRVSGRPRLAQGDAFARGLVEVQDEGSQLAAMLVDARPGMRVCDLCAGAGGKTLALAAAMANKGHIVACEVSDRRLEGATTRLRRAGAFNVELKSLGGERDPWIKRHKESFDRVLVDAPCTGTGTWRRNPDARWSLTQGDIDELAIVQASILESAWRLVRPGGRLIYATCSLLHRENEQQVDRFLLSHKEFGATPVNEVWAAVSPVRPIGDGPYLALSPARHGTDGFFVAVLTRRRESP
jgi:16S rRNA (cytosine967-C5)-methyltransferase